MKSKWIFLSYSLSDALSAYRNSNRIEISSDSMIEHGDTTNNTVVNMSSHFGTHIDFPYHFSETGNKSDDYASDFFLFSHVGVADVVPHGSSLISVSDMDAGIGSMSENVESIVIRTGLGCHRFEDRYWNDNYGFDVGVASYLRARFPKLRAIGFDLISVSCIHHREIGRMVHREFFEQGILPIEDMDLRELSNMDHISEMIVSPLRVERAEAAPVTVFAKIILG